MDRFILGNGVQAVLLSLPLCTRDGEVSAVRRPVKPGVPTVTLEVVAIPIVIASQDDRGCNTVPFAVNYSCVLFRGVHSVLPFGGLCRLGKSGICRLVGVYARKVSIYFYWQMSSPHASAVCAKIVLTESCQAHAPFVVTGVYCPVLSNALESFQAPPRVRGMWLFARVLQTSRLPQAPPRVGGVRGGSFARPCKRVLPTRAGAIRQCVQKLH